MAKILKTITAGKYCWQVLYPRIKRTDDQMARASKKKQRSAAQAFLDLKHVYQKIELWIMCNLRPGDHFLTLTYDDAHLPQSRKQAMGQHRAFRKRLKAEYDARGKKFVAAWCLESITSAGRYHFHMLCPKLCRNDAEIFLRCWRNGGVDVAAIRVGHGKTYEGLARYLAKEYPEKVGQHAWSCTRGSLRPMAVSETVGDGYQLKVPDGCELIGKSESVTPFGEFTAIKFKTA